MTADQSPADVHTEVRNVIAQVLRLSVDKVQPDTGLVRELGADSMDFVDITFSIEKAFMVEFCEEGMFAKLEELFGDDVLSRNGCLTEIGARVLRDRRPEVDPEQITSGMPVAQLAEHFTPETWARAVLELLEARPRACPSCGATGLAPARISRLSCEGCGTEVPCPSQADLLESWAREFRASVGGGD